MSFFAKLREGLAKTRQSLVEKIKDTVAFRKKIDEELFEELEETLIRADVGAETSLRLVAGLRREVREKRIEDPARIPGLLKEQIRDLLLGSGGSEVMASAPEGPRVIMVVGVNGAGKTTTIGKMAAQFKREGQKVLVAAGDTFRAAAIDQLEVWARRAEVEIIKGQEGSDPAALAYDAVQAAKSRRMDVVIIDTAGRLHTKGNLMEELKKIKRVVSRDLPGAPHEVLLVLDATTGQNAVQQARIFGEAAGVTGIVLTKLDGSGKGGVVIGIAAELKIPVKLIGVGEKIDDLRRFDPQDYVEALFGQE